MSRLSIFENHNLLDIIAYAFQTLNFYHFTAKDDKIQYGSKFWPSFGIGMAKKLNLEITTTSP